MRRRKEPRIQQKMAEALDDLAEFEQFKAETLAVLRQDYRNGMSADEMRKKYQAILTARAITIGVSEPDSGKAMTAIKDLVDRNEGKAKERVEHEHKFKELKEQELDALILSKFEKVAADERDKDPTVN